MSLVTGGMLKAMTLTGRIRESFSKAKQPAKARPAFERLLRKHAACAPGLHGLARVLTDTGAFDKAIAMLEHVRGLRGADALPIDYREAPAWLGKGDKPRAKALLQRFVARGTGHAMNLDDAKRRLVELG